MILHKINDMTNRNAIRLMVSEMSKITDEAIIKNYHPDYSDMPQNLFHILDNNGRYRNGNGDYYLMEEEGKFVCSAGWNSYEVEPTIALLLTRMYTTKKHRGKYIIGNTMLPIMLTRVSSYDKIIMTVNDHNRAIYQWFVRTTEHKKATLFGQWPEIYKKFKPIGKMEIYSTEQWVVEYDKGEKDDV